MIDELRVFARYKQFKLVLLRRPGSFYQESIRSLQESGVEVHEDPFHIRLDFRKLLFVLGFALANLSCFLNQYSFVIGVKSMWWFLKLKPGLFGYNCRIHAQFATQPAILSLMVSRFYRRLNIRYYFTFHAYDIYFTNRWFRKLVKHSIRSFSISKYNIRYVSEKYRNVDPLKIQLCRLGSFMQLPVSRPAGLDRQFCIGFISWLVPKKGLPVLLDAMEMLKVSRPEIRLIIAGDGPLRNYVEQFVETHQLSGTVSYIGKIGSAEKIKFFGELDAFVLPALTVKNDQDGIPVVLMEAISYGLPIISTNISGIPEICVHNYNGLLIPQKEVGALVDAIVTLADNPMLRTTFAANSNAMFAHYNIESNSYEKLRRMNWI